MQKQYNVIIEKGLDVYLISSVVKLPGCHTQAKNHDTLIKRTKEAIALYFRGTEKTHSFLEKKSGTKNIRTTEFRND